MSANDDSRPHTNFEDTAKLQKSRIRALNDRLRKTLQGGICLMTHGINALEAETRTKILLEIAQSSEFVSSNDPFNEHDFGKVVVKDHKVLWKIDYYDLDLTFASADPSDPNITTRVLTIMMASEY